MIKNENNKQKTEQRTKTNCQNENWKERKLCITTPLNANLQLLARLSILL